MATLTQPPPNEVYRRNLSDCGSPCILVAMSSKREVAARDTLVHDKHAALDVSLCVM
ncbi:hypothetical protein BGY98DRAFT_541820 [Russula aff. rugulosa BPL654]|nr:hypothetical protein BGY98DRAFT_541820 [Russula aff. rugulosa BPL654]